MKKITKFTKAILMSLVGVMVLCSTFVTKALESTIQLGDAETVPGYVSDVTFTTKTLANGDLLYCLDMNKKTAKNTSAKLIGEKDAGIAYIIANGYPNKTFTGERLKDYYITQTAIWWYLDNTTGSSNLSQKFKTNGSDQYGLRPRIQALVTAGENAKKAGYPQTKLSLSVSNNSMSVKENYFVSEAISATSRNLSTYTVKLESAPTGSKITDVNGNAKTTFNANEKFLVKVPANAVKATETEVKISASGTGYVYKAYAYQPIDPSMQPITPAKLEKEEIGVSTNLTLAIDSSKVTIKKIDKNTKSLLAGATLVLKDSAGNVIASWKSTTSEHIIRNLKAGTYSVVETEAPAGYILDSTPVKFTINDSSREATVTIENRPRQSVVNVSKIDASTGKPLAGAVLVLKDANQNIIERFVTTAEPKVFLNLANGTYTLEEDEAPAGYIRSSIIHTFTISDDELSHQIVYENYPEVIVPNTATSSAQVLLTSLLGIVIIGLGIKFVLKNEK